MNELTTAIKVLLANATVMYYKAHQFHWNIEGIEFTQYHEFFGDLYSEVYDNTIDRAAEFVRALDHYTPGSMVRFAELSVIEEQTKIPRAELMVAELYEDNSKILMLLNEVFPIANEENQGIANFIAERIDAHGKHGWMLRSILKKQRA
jgi:starvation-inducible DNA-binding protein